MAIASTAETQNNTGGNGQFSSLRRRANQQSNKSNSAILENTDPRMRFRNSADPIYVAYQYVDSQPISKLASSFVKESVFEIMNFVSSVIKG